MMAIPDDRFEAFLAELPHQLRELRKTLAVSRIVADFVSGRIEIGGVVWVDDGKTKTSVTYRVSGKEKKGAQ